MTGNFERGALILFVGFILGIVLLTGSISKNTAKLSKSLERAGTNSRGSYSASFPSSLRIQTTEKEQDIPIERRGQLANSFAAACIGREYLGKKVKKVEVERFSSENSGQAISLTGNLIFEDESTYENFFAYLRQDGLGGYRGTVFSSDKKDMIMESIKIQ